MCSTLAFLVWTPTVHWLIWSESWLGGLKAIISALELDTIIGFIAAPMGSQLP